MIGYPIPNIRFFARFEYDKTSKKTPKYVITKQVGYYPVMDRLRGKNSLISMYLQTSKDSGSKKDNAPAMRLQAKDSLNFTGLKDFYIDGKPSGYAYGYPLETETYSSKNKPNPFFEYKGDGFLFIVHYDDNAKDEALRNIPSYFELIVLERAKVLVSSYCKQLMMGGFDEVLKSLREQANNTMLL